MPARPSAPDVRPPLSSEASTAGSSCGERPEKWLCTPPAGTINYQLVFTPVSGSQVTINGSFAVTVDIYSTAYTGTYTGALGPLTSDGSLSGSANINGILPVQFAPVTLKCGTSGGTGCPGTIGYWKNSSKHPFPSSVQSSGLTIAGVDYSAADLYKILGTSGSGNAVASFGRQLVAALLNLAAGAMHNATAEGAILTAESLLLNNHLNLLTSYVESGSSLGQALTVQASILSSYNNASFGTCTEGPA